MTSIVLTDTDREIETDDFSLMGVTIHYDVDIENLGGHYFGRDMEATSCELLGVGPEALGLDRAKLIELTSKETVEAMESAFLESSEVEFQLENAA